jgi:hypothetical protein
MEILRRRMRCQPFIAEEGGFRLLFRFPCRKAPTSGFANDSGTLNPVTVSEQVSLRGRPSLFPEQLERSFLCLLPNGEQGWLQAFQLTLQLL